MTDLHCHVVIKLEWTYDFDDNYYSQYFYGANVDTHGKVEKATHNPELN